MVSRHTRNVTKAGRRSWTNGRTAQFVQFYYKTFDENRGQLASLYVRRRSRLYKIMGK